MIPKRTEGTIKPRVPLLRGGCIAPLPFAAGILHRVALVEFDGLLGYQQPSCARRCHWKTRLQYTPRYLGNLRPWLVALGQDAERVRHAIDRARATRAAYGSLRQTGKFQSLGIGPCHRFDRHRNPGEEA